MTSTTETPTVVRPLPGNVTTRWPCSICTGGTEKTAAPYGYVDEDGEHFVCDECVRDMQTGALRDSLAKEARKLADQAAVMAERAETFARRPWVIERTAEPIRAEEMAEAIGCDPTAWDDILDDQSDLEAIRRLRAEELIDAKIASGELVKLDNGGLIKAEEFDPSRHTAAQ